MCLSDDFDGAVALAHRGGPPASAGAASISRQATSTLDDPDIHISDDDDSNSQWFFI